MTSNGQISDNSHLSSSDQRTYTRPLLESSSAKVSGLDTNSWHSAKSKTLSGPARRLRCHCLEDSCWWNSPRVR